MYFGHPNSDVISSFPTLAFWLQKISTKSAEKSLFFQLQSVCVCVYGTVLLQMPLTKIVIYEVIYLRRY